MDTAGPTLQERALRSYRRLLVLERAFQKTVELLQGQGVNEAEAALCEGVRDILAELAEDSRIMSMVPLPFSEWRPDDDPVDGRWRTISQLERREVQQLVRACEDLIDYCEMLSTRRPTADRSGVDVRWHQETVGRFKSEAAFLLTEADERQHAGGRRSATVPRPQGSAHAGPFETRADHRRPDRSRGT